MPKTRSARPVAKPVAGRRLSGKRAAAKKSTAKKAVRKRVARKSAKKKSAKPKSRRALSRKRKAAVEKRNQTRAATNVMVGPEPIAVDPGDEVAVAAIAKRQVRTAVERVGDPPPATGIALVERVTRAVERELSQIEVIVGGHHVKPQQRTEAERRARTLASLARTLTEVRKLRAEENKLKPQHDDGPEDIDEFRRALSQKLDRLVRESQELYPEQPDGTGMS